MSMFKRKKGKVVDLSNRLARHQEREREMKTNFSPDSSGTLDLSSSTNSSSESDSSNSGNFFGGFFGGGSPSSKTETATSDAEERRKKLGKRILDMTNKIEELENEIYRMKQRMDLLEKKQRLDY